MVYWKFTNCVVVCRSYRSVGDETFMRAFETATLGYEEWTHEVCVCVCVSSLFASPLPLSVGSC